MVDGRNGSRAAVRFTASISTIFAGRSHPPLPVRVDRQEIASIVAWSERSVERIRREYVDDAAANVAIGRRLNARTHRERCANL